MGLGIIVWLAPRRVQSSAATVFYLLLTTLRRHATYAFWYEKAWSKAKEEPPPGRKMNAVKMTKTRKQKISVITCDAGSDKTTQKR
jgi:hypothetical protein